MKQVLLVISLALALSGCGLFAPKGERGPVTGPSSLPPALEGPSARTDGVFGSQSVRAETLDSTTEAEKAKALAAPAAKGERALGAVVVALGPPAEQGLWLKSELVTEVVPGRIETAQGQSLTLELRPGTGGALLSLAAFQALGLSLTSLPEVTVFAP